MRLYFLIASTLLCNIQVITQVVAQDTTYTQTYRPQLHFSPKTNWTNDPNGLVYFEGEYHLFYQYNPFGSRWGHMTWGHAVSKDLSHWQELPTAIAEDGDTMIFSGSVVIDADNTSGFGDGKTVPMIAIYTAHQPYKQSQHLAFSLNKGRTWTKFANNPVFDLIPNQKDFRDPYVFWNRQSQKWVMIVALPHEQKVLIAQSADLKKWEIVSDFQVKNKALGIWECPSLIEIKVQNSTQKKWLMLVSMGDGAPAGGSGMQYFVGDFDGKKFNAQDTIARFVDFGKDFYAAIPFGNTSEPIMLGWMNNWQYANDIPTSPFRGQMTLPRRMSLVAKNGKIELRQSPILANKGLTSFSFNKEITQQKTIDSHDLAQWIIEADGTKDFGLSLNGFKDEKTMIGYDATKKELYVDRTQSGLVNFNKNFSKKTAVTLLPNAQGKIKLQIILDRCSIEVFGNDGEAVLTNLFFPTQNRRPETWGVSLKNVKYQKLRSNWLLNTH